MELDDGEIAKDCDLAQKHIELLSVIRINGVKTCKPRLRHGPTQRKEFLEGLYDIPIKIYSLFQGNGREGFKLDAPLDTRNYVDRFKYLLWIEEAYKNVSLRRYDGYTNTEIFTKTIDNLFKLQVHVQELPRLGLIQNSEFLLIDYHSTVTKCYQAYVHAIGKDFIIIKTHDMLHREQNLPRLLAVFMESRISYIRCHNGVAKLRKSPNFARIVFPTKLEQPVHPKMNDMTRVQYFEKNLNNRQKAAVCNMVRAICRPAPYILFGPPGTGKTTTIVEAIIQVYDCREKSFRILVCGNSNLCTDHIAKCLLNSKRIPQDKMLRIYAHYRSEQDLIPENLKPISRIADDETPALCKKYRVIFSTCNLAAALYSDVDRARYDYIFIDEAGHSNEPETLIPINSMEDDGCFILAGDPHQLGPACSCNFAKRKKFDISFLERMFENPMYKPIPNRKKYDNRYITMLQTCYRSDRRLLTLNNDFFYDSSLILSKTTPIHLLKQMNFNYPLIFHSVKGRDIIQRQSLSRFNLLEAQKCVDHVKEFYVKANFTSEQIGVITYYKAQKFEIIKLFESKDVKPCKVDTVDGFQGDEREVIIISTVRIETKNKMNLSFMFDRKRFNVATSRAKHIAIVVGDDSLLSRDGYWRRLIETTKEKNSFIR